MKLAVIPARGGSKRIPRKNIKFFCGRPIIAWSIVAAKESDCFDEIIVSTDDPEIAEVGRQYGASIPFMRSAELSDDHVSTASVIRDAIGWYLERGQNPEKVCCIYATAPFVQSEDIQRGLRLLEESNRDYVFSVTRYSFPIQRAIRITSDDRVEMFHPEHFNTRSQDLEEAFHDAGQFYWGQIGAWLEERPFFSRDSAPVILPCHRVQDIDTFDDWQRAERMFKAEEPR